LTADREPAWRELCAIWRRHVPLMRADGRATAYATAALWAGDQHATAAAAYLRAAAETLARDPGAAIPPFTAGG
jgi:hypothetical protein